MVVVLPQKTVTPRRRRARRGHQAVVVGHGRRLRRHAHPLRRRSPRARPTLSFQARWNIEDCGPDACDYAYVEVDDGTGFKAIAGNITKPAEGNGIDGYQATYTPATFDLSAYAGKTVSAAAALQDRPAPPGQNPNVPSGIFADEIKLTSGTTTVFTDGAETGDNGWTPVGFTAVARPRSTRRTTTSTSRPTAPTRPTTGTWRPARTTSGSRTVRTGSSTSRTRTACSSPTGTRRQSDNNESQHPGQGLVLPIDANPRPIYRLDGKPWRGRIQTYDAPFGLEKSDSFTLHAQETGEA